MKIAIYEPDPRICGPDTWAQMLQRGFLELQHECDIVTFNKSGRYSPAWGRLERAKSSSMSCALKPTRCEKQERAGQVLDEYDLIVLTDVKTATCDNAARKADECWPTYVETLSETSTRFTSALHGRWYFAPHEVPEGLSEASGSPFIEDLLSLENFSGFLIAHASDFDRYCQALRHVKNKVLLPLPYISSCSDEMAFASRPVDTMCCIGRMIPTKHRHLINECMTRGMLQGWEAEYGGACVCTHGPSETYCMTEQLEERGWTTDWGDDGVRKTKPFKATHAGTHNTIYYAGCYEHPREVCCFSRAHVGITDCDFSGGLLEFATLEAMDCGCVATVTEPFRPHYRPAAYELAVWTESIRSLTYKRCLLASDGFYADLAETIRSAADRWSRELVCNNREAIRQLHYPTIHARTFIEGAL